MHDVHHGKSQILSKVLLQVVPLKVLGKVPHKESRVIVGPLGEDGVQPCLCHSQSDMGLGIGID